MTTVKVIFYDDSYASTLVAFLRKVWNKELTIDRFIEKRDRDMRENPFARNAGFPIAIAIKNDRVIGHHAGTPAGIWSNGQEYLSYWLAGLHVLPEGRRQGIAKALQYKTNELPLATSFWVVEATLRVKRKLGWTVVGKIPEYVKVLEPRSFIKTIGNSQMPQFRKGVKNSAAKLLSNGPFFLSNFILVAFQFYNRLTRSLFPKIPYSCSFRIVSSFDHRVDQLWEKSKCYIKSAQVRKSDYLNWRFKYDQGWIKIVAERDSEILGYAILSLKNLSKFKSQESLLALSIIDIFWEFSQSTVFHELLRYIETIGRENKASILICSINYKYANKALFQKGYLRIPGTVYFGFHSNVPAIKLSPRMKDWFLTRGDADASGSLGP